MPGTGTTGEGRRSAPATLSPPPPLPPPSPTPVLLVLRAGASGGLPPGLTHPPVPMEAEARVTRLLQVTQAVADTGCEPCLGPELAPPSQGPERVPSWVAFRHRNTSLGFLCSSKGGRSGCGEGGRNSQAPRVPSSLQESGLGSFPW